MYKELIVFFLVCVCVCVCVCLCIVCLWCICSVLEYRLTGSRHQIFIPQ